MSSSADKRGEDKAGERRVKPGRRSVQEKTEAVKAILAGKATVDSVAAKYGVRVETVLEWREQALEALQQALGTNEQGTPRERELERENKRLQKALADLAVERALLGQALEEWKKQSRPSRPRR